MTKRVRCPNCGVIHEIPEEVKHKAGLFESQGKRPFRTDAATIPLAGSPQIHKETPANAPSIDTHLRLPLKQAYAFGWLDAPIGMVIGVGGGFLAAIGLDYFMWVTRESGLTGWGVIGVCSLFGTGGGIIAFFKKARLQFPVRLELYDSWLWTAEEIMGFDIDGDNEIGEPESILRIEIQDSNGVPRLVADFNTDEERFTELAELILNMRRGFSEETAKEAGYSRKEWEAIRDRFIELKCATWNNSKSHQQGVSLTKNGKAVLEKTLTPPLSGGSSSKNTPGTNVQTRTNELRQNNGFMFTEK